MHVIEELHLVFGNINSMDYCTSVSIIALFLNVLGTQQIDLYLQSLNIFKYGFRKTTIQIKGNQSVDVHWARNKVTPIRNE